MSICSNGPGVLKMISLDQWGRSGDTGAVTVFIAAQNFFSSSTYATDSLHITPRIHFFVFSSCS